MASSSPPAGCRPPGRAWSGGLRTFTTPAVAAVTGHGEGESLPGTLPQPEDRPCAGGDLSSASLADGSPRMERSPARLASRGCREHLRPERSASCAFPTIAGYVPERTPTSLLICALTGAARVAPWLIGGHRGGEAGPGAAAFRSTFRATRGGPMRRARWERALARGPHTWACRLRR